MRPGDANGTLSTAESYTKSLRYNLMKRLFTFAIVALIAAMAFAQSQQAQRRVAYTTVQHAMHVGQLGPKAQAEMLAKAQAANEVGQTRLARATNPAAGYQQLTLTDNVLAGAKVGRTAPTAPYKAPAKVTETDGNLTITKDAHGIITNVEGVEPQFYTRANTGVAYYSSNGSMAMTAQSGNATIIMDGNNVYMLNPITRYTQGTWVKGVKNGNTITVATKQPLAWNTQYGTTISLRWGVITAASKINNADSYADVFTFTINGDVITLEGTQAYDQTGDAYFMGAFWDDDDTTLGYGDAESVLTLNSGYTPPSTTLVVPPAGVTAEGWYLNGSNVTASGESPIKNQAVNVAFDGNDVYVQGIFEYFPNAWVKGTKNGNVYEFGNFQFIGTYSTNNIWMVGVNGITGDMLAPKATYDSAKKTLTFNCDLLANAADDRVYYLSWVGDPVLSADEVVYEEPILNTQTATLPYVNSFDTPEEQAQVAIYDANNDGKTFSFDTDTKTNSTVGKYTYNSSSAADDYLVFPAVPLEVGKKYIISVDARANSSTYDERVAVICGKESKISAMTTTVIEPTTVVGTEYVTLTNGEFSVSEAGMYSFAIKACSDKDKFYLYVDNFSIKEANLNAPVAPADVVVTPDATGANKATVTLTAPNKNLAGNNLTGVLDMVIAVDGVDVVTKQVTAGAAVSEEITVEAPGTYKVVVKFSCAAGVTDPVTVSAYIGVDVPTEPDNFELQDKNTSVGMSWTAPQEGVNGAPFFPEDLVYNIYPVEMMEFLGMVFPMIDYDNPYATGISGTSYDLEYNTNEGEQAYTFFGLAAENAAGEGEGIYKAMLTGAPYTLPVKESLAGGSLGYWWGSDCDNNNYYLDGGLYAGDNASDDDGFCLEFQGMTEGWAFLKSGKIALAGAANPVYQFDAVKTLGTVTLDVYVETSEGQTKLQTIDPTDEYATYTVSLADYKDAVWVSVILYANFEGYASGTGDPIAIVDIDNIKVVNLLDHNLAVTSLNAPARVNVGTDLVATATVENQGSLDVAAADYTVKFTVNGEVTVLEGVDLAANASAEFTYTLPTSVASAESYAIKAEAVYAADEDQANNTSAEVTVKVAFPNYPTVANLTAEVEGKTVNLAWDEPDLENIAPEPVTDDFESYAPGVSVAIGEWTLVDVDQSPMGGIQGMDIPNLTPGTTVGSFFVMNQDVVAGNDLFAGNSGVQYLSTMFAYDGETYNNDWLISPALSGEAQTISFFAKTYTAQYGAEKINVLYSTTDTNLASFVALNDAVVNVPDTWTEYTYDLPAGAKYFAIQCVSEQAFMLFVDDITYIPAVGATADLEIVGYNVYCDGVKVNEEPVAETSYVATDLAANTTYTYAVSVVYTQGESKAEAVEATIAADLVTIEPNVYYNLQILDTDLYLSAGWQDNNRQVNTLEKDEEGYAQAFMFVPVADKDDVYNIVANDGKTIYASGGWDCFWNDEATEANLADAAYQFSVEPQYGYIYIKTKNGYIGSDGIWNWSKVWTDKGTDKAVKFSPIKRDDITSGINAIEAEEDAVYYNMQGVRLANPAIGQPCIRVANGKAVKVIIR